MKPLKRLKVGRRFYNVSYKHLPPDTYGQVDAEGRHRLIEVSELLTPNETAYATVHELLHAIWDSRRLPPRAYEEKAVTHLAWGLVNAFRDNPGLLLHLDKLITERA